MEENQIVLITGAKGGLGSFVTEAFLAAGDTVIGTSKSIQASDFSNPRFVAMASDLTDPASTSHLVDCVMERFRRIVVLVHVMGGCSGGKPIGETDDATWDRMMNCQPRRGRARGQHCGLRRFQSRAGIAHQIGGSGEQRSRHYGKRRSAGRDEHRC